MTASRQTHPGTMGAEQRARLLIVALGAAVVFALVPFLSGLLGGIVLYVALVPLHRRLEHGIGRRAAALVLVAAAMLLLLLPGAWLLATIVSQAPESLSSIQQSEAFRRLTTLRIGSLEVGAEIAAAGRTLIGAASRQMLVVFGGATRATLNLLIALFGLYYLLASNASIWPSFKRYLPFSDSTAEALRHRFYAITEATIVGIAVTATLQGTVVGVAFALVGLPNPTFWGLATALVSVLPVLGSAIIWLPGTIVLLLDQRYGAAITLGVIGLIVASNVDNLARLAVYRQVSRTHPMITLVGAFAGVRFFGLAGLLLGPLAITYFFELLKFYRDDYGHAEVEPSGVDANAPAYAGR